MRRHLDPVVTALEQGHGQSGGTLGGFKSGSDDLRARGGSLDGRHIGDWLGLVHWPHGAGLGQAAAANKRCVAG